MRHNNHTLEICLLTLLRKVRSKSMEKASFLSPMMILLETFSKTLDNPLALKYPRHKSADILHQVEVKVHLVLLHLFKVNC
mmetsp:Transcript_28486/g.39361  ORF Transcript_28486/g.39361 Transcript_28486/m.39361 type:complete len:81 (-) Transcript_28486:17-259(-)